jgi:hypothetical protein
LLVTANVVPSSQIIVTLMMEALSSSGTCILTRVTWRDIPENGILHSHHRENLKSYMNLFPFSYERKQTASFLDPLNEVSFSKEPNRVSPAPHLRMATGPVSGTICFLILKFRTMDKVQKAIGPECYTPSSGQ